MAVSIKNFFKMGLGLGVGFQVSAIIFTFLGLIFIIPGYILFKNEADSGKKGSATQIGGFILMAFGVVIMGGFGFSMLFDGINNMS